MNRTPGRAIVLGTAVVGALIITAWFVLNRGESAQRVLEAQDSVSITIDGVEDASGLIADPAYSEMLERTIGDHGTFRIDVENGTLVGYGYAVDAGEGLASEDPMRPALTEQFTWAFIVDDSMPLEDHATRIWAQAAPLLAQVNGGGNSDVRLDNLDPADTGDRVFLEQFGQPVPEFARPSPSNFLGRVLGGGERDHSDDEVFKQRRHSLKLTVMYSDGLNDLGEPEGDPRFTQLTDGRGIVYLEAELEHRSLSYPARDPLADTPLADELRESLAPVFDNGGRFLESQVTAVPHWLSQDNGLSRLGVDPAVAVQWADHREWDLPNRSSVTVVFDDVFANDPSCEAVFEAINETLGVFASTYGAAVVTSDRSGGLNFRAEGDGYTMRAALATRHDCRSDAFASAATRGRDVSIEFVVTSALS